MKRVVNFLIAGLMMLSMPLVAQVQKNSDDRMKRDIAVMETALTEMIKQEFDQRNFFFVDIKGNYVPGYGVTFTVPTGMFNTGAWSASSNDVLIVDGNFTINGLTLSTTSSSDAELAITETEAEDAKNAMKKSGKDAKNAQKERDKAEREAQVAEHEAARARDLHERSVYGAGNVNRIGTQVAPRYRRVNTDSISAINNAKVIAAAKTFIADYGDMLSQLAPEERIIVTNRGNNEGQFWYNGQKAKRSLLTVETTKRDLTDFRQGKVTREQLLEKIKVVNTVTSDKVEPDMELLASIFNRLYKSDLSKTYYLQGNAYYERLTDFGTILHLQVVSSVGNNDNWGTSEKDIRLSMPTLGLQNLTQEERDKKVKELYPLFESELKDNILEYGRTLRSLKDTEQLMVNVTMTKCKGCGIPATLELAVKASVLKDFNAGKLDKNAALSKIEVKKGVAQ